MKKIALLSFMIYICISISSCSYKNSDTQISEPEISSTTITSSPGSYITSKIYPLDKEYMDALSNSDGSIASFVDTTISYGDRWKEKTTTYYNELYKYLDNEGKRLLMQSQNDWNNFYLSGNNLNQHIMNSYEPTGGKNAAINYIILVRSRAIDLFEKCQQLGISVE